MLVNFVIVTFEVQNIWFFVSDRILSRFHFFQKYFHNIPIGYSASLWQWRRIFDSKSFHQISNHILVKRNLPSPRVRIFIKFSICSFSFYFEFHIHFILWFCLMSLPCWLNWIEFNQWQYQWCIWSFYINPTEIKNVSLYSKYMFLFLFWVYYRVNRVPFQWQPNALFGILSLWCIVRKNWWKEFLSFEITFFRSWKIFLSILIDKSDT